MRKLVAATAALALTAGVLVANDYRIPDDVRVPMPSSGVVVNAWGVEFLPEAAQGHFSPSTKNRRSDRRFKPRRPVHRSSFEVTVQSPDGLIIEPVLSTRSRKRVHGSAGCCRKGA